jgi:hypothetical protein
VLKSNAVKLAGIVSEAAFSNNIIELQVTCYPVEYIKGKVNPLSCLIFIFLIGRACS